MDGAGVPGEVSSTVKLDRRTDGRKATDFFAKIFQKILTFFFPITAVGVGSASGVVGDDGSVRCVVVFQSGGI